MKPTVTISLEDYNRLLMAEKELAELRREIRSKEPFIAFKVKQDLRFLGNIPYLLAGGIDLVVGKDKIEQQLIDEIKELNERCESVSAMISLNKNKIQSEESELTEPQKPWYKRIF